MTRKKFIGGLAASFLSVFFIAPSATAAERTITDVIGREVKVDLPAKRVVLGFYFEDYMAVGGEKAYDSVVGISREAWEGWVPANWKMHLAHRASLADIADVGEVEAQTFSVEKVLSLNPDLVILADWQYKALGLDADRLEEEGIPVVVVDYNAQTVERHVASTRLFGELTGQQVEQIEEGVLAAIGQGDVAGRDRPAQLLAEQPGQRPGESVLALGAIVVGHGLDQFAVVEQGFGLGLKAFQHGGDGGRVAASQHDGVWVQQSLIEVIHELGNTGVASELLAEQGEFHSVANPESVRGRASTIAQFKSGCR